MHRSLRLLRGRPTVRAAAVLAGAIVLWAWVGWPAAGPGAGVAWAGAEPAEKLAEEVTIRETPAAPAEAEPAAPGAEPPAAGEKERPSPHEDLDAAAEKFAAGVSELLQKALGRWVRYEVLGIEVWQFLAAFFFILVGLAAKKVSDFLMEQRLLPLLKRTRFKFDHLLAEAAYKPLGYLLLLGGLAGAAAVMRLPTEPNVRGFAYAALKVLLAADVLWFLFRGVDVAVLYLAGIARRTDSRLDDQLVPILRKALKVTLAIFVAVWVVQLLGYSVSSLIAGLGIGGLAVALALQDTLSNFFGSIFIFIDRPFAVGDMVKIGDVEGTIEQIGFRSTRIRTWSKTLVAIPNKHVADSKIDNWSRMPSRRVNQVVGVTYETTADQMEQCLAAIREILAADEGVDPEYKVARFEEFGDSSLNIRVVYFTKAIVYADHLVTRERVNLAIMRAIRRLGLSIAFPTRTLYLEGDVAKRLVGGTGSGPGPQAPGPEGGPGGR